MADFLDEQRWTVTGQQCREFSGVLTSEMLEMASTCTSVELTISGEVVSKISTATESRRRALKDTPSPRPSFRSWCSSIRVYWRVEPYILTQAGPMVGRNPGEGRDYWSFATAAIFLKFSKLFTVVLNYYLLTFILISKQFECHTINLQNH